MTKTSGPLMYLVTSQ